MLNAVDGLAVEQHVDQLDRAAGGVQRRPIRTLARDRVGVEVSASRRRDPLDRVDVLGRVHRGQVGLVHL